jgi:copper chaperone CopZ
MACLGCGQTPPSFNVADAPTVEFNVPDMMCADGCGVAVEGILSKQPGVKDVLIDFPAKKAIVAIEEGKFNSDKALAALVDKQFLNSSLTADIATKPQAEQSAPAQ